jgi:transketolase
MDPKLLKQMKLFATTVRIETMKEFKIRTFGHVGGAMSIADTLSVLYEGVMRYDPKNPAWADRDKLVCSKGHAGPTLYSILALKGFFPLDWLSTLNIPGTRLPSHCDRNQTPGIDMTTGSLGQGMSTAIGMCLGDKIQGRDSYTFLIVGDGELNEGQIWEGAQFAGHHKMDHLIAFCDYNKKQLDGYTADIIDQKDIGAKFVAFGWDAQQVDGQDAEAVYEAIQTAKATPGKPHMIVLDTIKGAGIKAVEEMSSNHHIVVSAELADQAIADLEKLLAEQKG